MTMKQLQNLLTRSFQAVMAVTLGLAIVLLPATSVSAAPRSNAISQVQEVAARFGIPVGPIDGLNGPNTAQGFCALRYVTGLTASRAVLDTNLYNTAMRYADPVRYPNGSFLSPRSGVPASAIVVDQTCQTMFVYQNGRLAKVFMASTGRPGLETPNGVMTLGYTVRGWTCSTIYHDNCSFNRSQGKYANIPGREKGNMYNKRAIYNNSHKEGEGFKIHGSLNVPTTPGSGGCVRIHVADADWLSDTVATGTTVIIQGRY